MYILSPYDGGRGFDSRVTVVIAAKGERVLRNQETYVAAVDKKRNFFRLWKGTGKEVMRQVNCFRLERKLQPISKKEWDAMPITDSGFLSL